MTSKKPSMSKPASQGTAEKPAAESADSRLDEALDESFPASDPIAVDLTDPHHVPEKGASSEEKKRR